jgi:hypothetical protein
MEGHEQRALGPVASGQWPVGWGSNCSVEVENRRSSVEVDVRVDLFQK